MVITCTFLLSRFLW